MTPKFVPPSEISISDLPFDLLCFPLMLMLLSVLSVGVALAVLAALVCLILLRHLYRKRLHKMRVSLLAFGLQLGSWGVLQILGRSHTEDKLLQQLLWIVSFLVVHLIGFVLIRQKRFPRLETPTCTCDKRRTETLIAEYRRFDKVLLRFCLIALVLCVPFLCLVRSAHLWAVLMSQILSISALALICVELYHLAWLRRHLKDEIWLPLLDEQNRVIGRIPRSDADGAEGILARIRLVAISRNMIYLERISDGDAQYYDSPFVDWLSEDDSPDIVAQRMIDARFCGIRRAKPRHLLPYRIQMNGRQYLIHLMIVEIEEPDQLYIDCRPVEGKWWCIDHLRPLLGQSDISPYLESEIPILEHTHFLAHRLLHNHE